MRVVVAGAGLTGRRLVARLAADRHDVTVVDLSHDVCELISAKLGVTAICGSATDIGVLEEAELAGADVAVALMRDSADNLAFALLARGMGVERIVARMPNPQYRTAYEQAGVTGIIDIAGLFIEAILLEIEHPQLREVASFANGRGIIISLVVSDRARGLGKTIAQIHANRRWPQGCLIVGIVRRNGAIVIPRGPEEVQLGDELIISGSAAEIGGAVEYFGGRTGLFKRRTLPSDRTQAELDTLIEGKNHSVDD